jgi:hypothetical protein
MFPAAALRCGFVAQQSRGRTRPKYYLYLPEAKLSTVMWHLTVFKAKKDAPNLTEP